MIRDSELTMSLKKLLLIVLLTVILLIAFWIRIQGLEILPNGQFTETDAYFYFKQAQVISKQGKLPARDMSRWLPYGRDLTQTLHAYPTALAYTHKAVSFFFPNVSLYGITLFVPVICFVLGLALLCLFFYRTFGMLFCSIFGVLLATLPGAIERSTPGFADRDSWCLLIGVIAITSYLMAMKTERPLHRLIFTLVSGFSVFVGGLSWEGFGVFTLCILIIEIWQFLSTKTEKNLVYYLLWVSCFIPTLYLTSPVYRNGEGFTTHVAVFLLIPPLVVLGMRSLRYYLITESPFAKKIKAHSRSLAFALIVVVCCGALIYILRQVDTFDTTVVSLSQTSLMQSIGELENPTYSFWVFRYGGIFILGSLGFLFTVIYPAKKFGHFLFAVPLVLFIITTFLRGPFDALSMMLWKVPFDNTLFYASMAGIVFGFLLRASRRDEYRENDTVFIVMSGWFFCWVALTRDAQRYDFFVAVPLAFFTTVIITALSNMISQKLKNFKYTLNLLKQHLPQELLNAAIACVVLALLMFWPPVGAYTNFSLYTATEYRKPLPGDSPLADVIDWMKTDLPENAVMAANWEYGNQLNVLGEIKTIIDPDHYIPERIHLFFRHLYAAQSDQEALEFLKTHGVTHLMFTKRDILLTENYSTIGSDEQGDRRFLPVPLQFLNTVSAKPQQLFNLKNTPFNHIDVDLVSTSPTLTVSLKDSKSAQLPYVMYKGIHRTVSLDIDDAPYGGVVMYFDSKENLRKAYYLSTIGWNSLIVRLYLRGVYSDVFEPIYPQKNVAFSDIKVWKINYSPNVKPNVKYLATEP